MKTTRLLAFAALASLALTASTCKKDNIPTPPTPPQKEDPTPTPGPETDLDTIRVMQFNILQATSETAGHEWATVRKQPCINMFKDKDPDIVCVQESRKSQCNDLASALPEYAQIKHPKDDIETNGGQRNLIMYKYTDWTPVKWDKLWFSVDRTAKGDRFGDAATTQKMLLYVDLMHKSSKKHMWVFDAHFFASCDNPASRDSCVKITLNTIQKVVPEGVACVFCGDLNINYMDSAMLIKLKPLMNYMDCASLKCKITDGPTQVTYNKFTPTYTKVLDYIFYKNAVGLEYHVVNSKDYGTDFISDHYPVYCDMVF